MDFLLGLGQTIPALSDKGKTILLGRIKKGLDEGLWPLRHELGVAANLSKRGWDIRFHDFEEGGGFDFLATKDGMTYEVEAKAISAFTGWPIKPDNLNKLLVEVKQHFVWNDVGVIPVIGATLSSNLRPTGRSFNDWFRHSARSPELRRDLFSLTRKYDLLALFQI